MIIFFRYIIALILCVLLKKYRDLVVWQDIFLDLAKSRSLDWNKEKMPKKIEENFKQKYTIRPDENHLFSSFLRAFISKLKRKSRQKRMKKMWKSVCIYENWKKRLDEDIENRKVYLRQLMPGSRCHF